jgi:hypothetical protein
MAADDDAASAYSAAETNDEDEEEVRLLRPVASHAREVDPDFERELAALISQHQGAAPGRTLQVSTMFLLRSMPAPAAALKPGPPPPQEALPCTKQHCSAPARLSERSLRQVTAMDVGEHDNDESTGTGASESLVFKVILRKGGREDRTRSVQASLPPSVRGTSSQLTAISALRLLARKDSVLSERLQPWVLGSMLTTPLKGASTCTLPICLSMMLRCR